MCMSVCMRTWCPGKGEASHPGSFPVSQDFPRIGCRSATNMNENKLIYINKRKVVSETLSFNYVFTFHTLKDMKPSCMSVLSQHQAKLARQN